MLYYGTYNRYPGYSSMHISWLIISTFYFTLFSFRLSAHLSWSYRGGFLLWVSPRMQPRLAWFLCFYYLFNKTRYVKSRGYIDLLYTHASFRILGVPPTVSKSRKVSGTVPCLYGLIKPVLRIRIRCLFDP
jgi:hypothetical protein